jgi:tetratricopeptide (TPR) repeat protein/class 3 adenylate cyclase
LTRPTRPATIAFRLTPPDHLAPQEQPATEAGTSPPSAALEIAHVLFMDIVAYSMLPMDQQQGHLHTLQEAVRNTPEFVRAQSEDRLIRLPTGDGMALVFFGDPVAPVRCALELSRTLREHPETRLRMGIHTGPVYRVADINANRNVAGGGINLAQRVMDCGDAGHILLSKNVAEVLVQVTAWKSSVKDLGEAEVKHGVRVRLFSLYTADAGNPNLPQKLHKATVRKAAKWSATGIAVFALVLVSLIVWYFLSGRGKVITGVNQRRSVAVLGFRNLTGKPDEAWLSTALSEMLTTELGAGEQLRTVPGENVARMKTDLELPDADSLGEATLSKVYKNLGSDLVVLGSYLDVGGQLRLDLRVQDAAAGETLATVSETGSESELLDIVNRAGASLRKKCGVTEITASLSEAVKSAQPKTAESARWYAEGLAKLRTWDGQAARELLEKAVAADPNYAPAHSALAAAWSRLGYDTKSQEEAKKAYDLSVDLPREQRLNIEGRYYVATRQADKAIDIYHTLFSFFPDNVEYGLSLAAAQRAGGKTKDALVSLESLRSLPSPSKDDPRIDLEQALSLESLGDLSSAVAASEAAAQMARRQGSRLIAAQARIEECFELSGLGKFPPAKAACEEAEGIYSGTTDLSGFSKALMNTGNLLADKGEFEKARNKYERAILGYRKIGNKSDLAWALNNLGTVLTEQRNYESARKLHEEALPLFQETGQKRGEAATLNNMANVLEAEGELEQASKAYSRAAAIQRGLGDKRRIGLVLGNLARLSYLQGRLRESREEAQEAASIHQQIGSKSLYANALTQLASLDAAEANLAQASKTLLEAQAVYTTLADKWSLAECQVQRARIFIEEGNLVEAEELSRKAVDEFRSDKGSEREASAHLALAEVFVAQARLSAAEQELKQAISLANNTVNREMRFDRAITAARVDAASGDSSKALRGLELIWPETVRYGYVSYQFDVRLVRGEIEIKSGETAIGRAHLAALEKDAAAKGFLLIAHKAAAAAKGSA